MKKNTVRSKKTQQKKTEKLFIRVMCVLLALVMILGLVEAVIGRNNTGSTYTVTEDGHVHAADGTHLGTVEELFGEGAGTVVTEDGTLIGTVGEEGAAAE